MNDVFIAAKELVSFLRKRRWKFCMIGGLVVARWGEERPTKDVDVTLWTEVGGEGRFVDALLSEFRPRVPDAKAFARDYRVLLCEARNGTGIDMSLGGLVYAGRSVWARPGQSGSPGVMEPANPR